MNSKPLLPSAVSTVRLLGTHAMLRQTCAPDCATSFGASALSAGPAVLPTGACVTSIEWY